MNPRTPFKQPKKKTDVNEEMRKHIRELLDRQGVKNRAMARDGGRHQLFVDANMLKKYVAARVKIEMMKFLPNQHR